MVGIRVFRILFHVSTVWLPLLAAVIMLFAMLGEIRSGLVAVNSRPDTALLARLDTTEPGLHWDIGSGYLLETGQRVDILMKPAAFAGDGTAILSVIETGRTYPAFIEADLASSYQASPSLFGLPATPYLMTMGLGFLWLLALSACAYWFIGRRSDLAGGWTVDSPEMRQIRDRAARLHRDHPALYRAHVVTTGLLGLLFLPSLLILLLLSVGYLIFILSMALPAGGTDPAVMVPVVAFTGGLILLAGLRLMQGWLPRLEGVPLDGHAIQELRSLIRDACEQAGFSGDWPVLITGHYQLELLPVNRGGLLPRTNLVIGLPLLQSLSPQEFRAALHAEIARHDRRGGWLGAWIYRWHLLFRHIRNGHREHQNFLVQIAGGFLDQFAPSFNALAYALVQDKIRQADKVAANRTSPKVTADSILRTHFSQQQFETAFWNSYYEGAYGNRYPDILPFDLTAGYFSTRPFREILRDSLGNDSATIRPPLPDLPGSLRDRLAALRMMPTMPARLNICAARAYLGAAEPSIREALNMIWWQKSEPIWAACHDHYQTLAERQQQLDKRFEAGTLTESQWLEWADIIRRLDGWDAAAECYELMLTHFPANPEANYTAGWIRLYNKDLSGLQMLEIAAEGDPELSVDICRDAVELLEQMDEPALLADWHQRLVHEKAVFRQDQTERGQLLDSDTLIEHDLGTQEMKDLIHAIETVPEVEQAFLAKKQVKARPETPLYVLGIHGPDGHRFFRGTDPIAALREKLNLQFDTFVVPLNNNFKKLQRQFDTMDRALIFKRSGQLSHYTGDGGT